METLSTYQVPIFLYSCVLGAILGLYYDIFKIFRIAIKFTQRQLFFCDLFFMSTSAFITFIFLLALNSGQIRMHLLTGELIGFIIYRFTLSKIIIFCSSYIINTIKNKIIAPLILLIIKFINILKSKISRILKYLKNNKKIVKEKLQNP